MYRPLLLALAFSIALPGLGAAQAGSCQLIENEYTQRRVENGFSTVFIQGPLLVRCEGGAEIRAQQGTLYEATREIHLSGSVSFVDPERRLTSQRATYSSGNGRLYATGDVVFSDLTEGMTLRGPELEYFRAMQGRPQTQAIATQRPHLTLLPRSRAGSAAQPGSPDGEPVEVDADRMTMEGNEQFFAVGRVEIRRSDFQAFSREARLDQVNQRMELRENARVQGEQFDLTGQSIDVLLPEDRLERVHAQRDAALVGEDLRIDAADLQLFFAQDSLQRMVARHDGGTARPVASARAFRLEADSLDAHLPNQVLDRVIAVGNARGESLDTTNAPEGRLTAAAPAGSFTATDRDWIVGDTVTGFFAPAETVAALTDVAPDDTTVRADQRGEIEIRRLVAEGSARSLYRIQNNQNGVAERPGLNYLVGEMIALSFESGELEVADVRGLQRGLYLDAAAPAAETPAAPPPAEAASLTASAPTGRRR